MPRESKIALGIAILYFFLAVSAIAGAFSVPHYSDFYVSFFNVAILVTLPCSMGYVFFMWSYMHGAGATSFVVYLIMCAAINAGIIYWLTRAAMRKLFARRRDAA